MSRYTGAVCKLCRREGKKLFLKGDRCYTHKCSIDRRNYAPGQHGQNRRKSSEYGIQLRAKQQARRYYGIGESQFQKYFLMAERRKGITGENLLQICESRLDNVVYSAGWANSRAEARQLVTHGHSLVNGQKVDIPSYLCKAGDVIAIKKSSLDSDKFKTLLEANKRVIPLWIERSEDGAEAKIVNLPTRDQIELDVQEHLIVEYYSK